MMIDIHTLKMIMIFGAMILPLVIAYLTARKIDMEEITW